MSEKKGRWLFFVPSFCAACVKARPSQEVLFLRSEDGLKNLQLGNTILIDSHVDQLIKPKKTKSRRGSDTH